MRLIDADAFLQRCDKIIKEENENPACVSWSFAYDNVKDEINEQPTVDAVPVVRCKDCIHCEDGECRKHLGIYDVVSDMDFCSRGERKDKTE